MGWAGARLSVIGNQLSGEEGRERVYQDVSSKQEEHSS